MKDINRTGLLYKNLGGKALTGTLKQKKWAEQIRNGVLGEITESLAREVCSNPDLRTAKTWIENRHHITSFVINLVHPYSGEGKFTCQIEELVNKIKEIENQKTHDEYGQNNYAEKLKTFKINKHTKKYTVHVKISDSHTLVNDNKAMYQIRGTDLSQQSYTKFTLTENQMFELFELIEITNNRFEIKWKKVKGKL